MRRKTPHIFASELSVRGVQAYSPKTQFFCTPNFGFLSIDFRDKKAYNRYCYKIINAVKE